MKRIKQRCVIAAMNVLNGRKFTDGRQIKISLSSHHPTHERKNTKRIRQRPRQSDAWKVGAFEFGATICLSIRPMPKRRDYNEHGESVVRTKFKQRSVGRIFEAKNRRIRQNGTC